MISLKIVNLEFRPAAHESYLLSKNLLVTIGVSKFPPRVRQFLLNFCLIFAPQIALVRGRLKPGFHWA